MTELLGDKNLAVVMYPRNDSYVPVWLCMLCKKQLGISGRVMWVHHSDQHAAGLMPFCGEECQREVVDASRSDVDFRSMGIARFLALSILNAGCGDAVVRLFEELAQFNFNQAAGAPDAKTEDPPE